MSSNIEKRVKKGYEKIKQIFNYLDDICFGKFHFVVAKILRETLFLSSLLLNSEAWYSIDKKSIEELEKVDNILLKKILELPSSTPAAFVHLELGTLPIRYVIMTRRLLFLQYILKEKGDSLIHSFLVAQMEDTKKGDWWETVQNDIVEIKLNVSLSEIIKMSEESFKALVKTHVAKAALLWLNNEKQRSKKIRNIEYSDLKIQEYLKSDNLNVDQRKLLAHLRGQMVKVRANYSKMYETIFCSLCEQSGKKFVDSQEHLLHCRSLCKYGDISIGTEYLYIYSEEPSKYESITILLEQNIKLREKLLRNKTNLPGEPSKVFCYTRYDNSYI